MNTETGKYDLFVNDATMWDIKFFVSIDENEINVPVILCADLINSWTHLAEAEREMLIDEIPDNRYSLCPNMTEF